MTVLENAAMDVGPGGQKPASARNSGALHTGQLHSGMPPLDTGAPPVSFFEFWPPLIFYFPMFIYWAWLAVRYRGLTLPTIANPLFPVGGLIGETKLDIFKTISAEGMSHIAPFTDFQRGEHNKDAGEDSKAALARIEEAGLRFPIVAKPNIGRRGAGVRLIKNAEELAAYMESFPLGQFILFQRFVPYEPEAGVFYVRLPGEESGRVMSLTLKYFPYAIGDGRATLRELIERDPRAGRLPHLYLPRHKDRLDEVIAQGEPFRLAFAGSHSRGAIFRDGEAHITPAMSQAFDRLAKAIPEFYFGRFDVRFPDIESLKRGEDFVVIEINGAGGEATHIWDSRMSLPRAYGALIKQYRLLWQVAVRNRKRGFRAMPLFKLIRAYRKELDLEAAYPLTE